MVQSCHTSFVSLHSFRHDFFIEIMKYQHDMGICGHQVISVSPIFVRHQFKMEEILKIQVSFELLQAIILFLNKA